jgi:hypothetical protein
MSSLVLQTRSDLERPSHRRRLSRPAALFFFMALLFPLTATCRSVAVPPGDRDPSADGTVSGTVRGPDGVAPAAGREVEAVEVETGRRYTAQTNVAGSYSLMVPAGRYRLELKLEAGESLAREPEVVAVRPGELAKGQDFTLGGAGIVEED